MRRAALERQFCLNELKRLARVIGWRNLRDFERKPNTYRKGEGILGCGKSRCFVCHGEKLLGYKPRSLVRSDDYWRDALRDLDAAA